MIRADVSSVLTDCDLCKLKKSSETNFSPVVLKGEKKSEALLGKDEKIASEIQVRQV